MRIHPIARRSLLVPAVGLALAAAMTACSSGSSSSAGASASATTSSAEPASASATASPSVAASSPAASGSAAAIATIKKNWETFLNGKTPAATKIGLVQDGQKFAAVLRAAAANPQGQTASASVKSVTLTSPTQAQVVYTILVSGTPMLQGQKGVAVYENGTWKVSVSSFCALAALQNGGKAPAGCS